MSLNSEQMLPARVRKMRQMEDLLNVEDIILAEIERIIDEMYGAAALLHEELVNEAWLKEKLDARTGADTTVEADADTGCNAERSRRQVLLSLLPVFLHRRP